MSTVIGLSRSLLLMFCQKARRSDESAENLAPVVALRSWLCADVTVICSRGLKQRRVSVQVVAGVMVVMLLKWLFTLQSAQSACS